MFHDALNIGPNQPLIQCSEKTRIPLHSLSAMHPQLNLCMATYTTHHLRELSGFCKFVQYLDGMPVDQQCQNPKSPPLGNGPQLMFKRTQKLDESIATCWSCRKEHSRCLQICQPSTSVQRHCSEDKALTQRLVLTASVIHNNPMLSLWWSAFTEALSLQRIYLPILPHKVHIVRACRSMQAKN